MKALAVYFDSECAFCQWSRRIIQRWDREHKLRFIDFRECSNAPFSPDEMAGAMHVLDPQGNWFGGYEAFLSIIKALPRLRWAAPLLQVAPVRWLGSWIYSLIARNRYGISSLLFRVAAVPRPCGEHVTRQNFWPTKVLKTEVRFRGDCPFVSEGDMYETSADIKHRNGIVAGAGFSRWLQDSDTQRR